MEKTNNINITVAGTGSVGIGQATSIKLHIFNPEHDMALAANQERFTAPHAGRQMRADLGFLPALWAAPGDMVLVDDVEAAIESVRHVGKYVNDVLFVALPDLHAMQFGDVVVEPWGWNRALKRQLLMANPGLERFLPTDSSLSAIRAMSSRKFASEHLLPVLRKGNPCGMVGESFYCAAEQECLHIMSQFGKSVLKSPWSSSGRGVRYIEKSAPDSHTSGWLRNVIRRQGGIMVEPLYNKVFDFGLEFCSLPSGKIAYSGLSLFATRGSAYTGSICATEADKRDMLSRYVDLDLLDSVREQIMNVLQPLMRGVYAGPFGIDMMAVAKEGADGFLLHPCVELNLRRTMGHVALAVAPNEFEPRRVMSVYYADKYRIRIQTTTDNLLNTGLI